MEANQGQCVKSSGGLTGRFQLGDILEKAQQRRRERGHPWREGRGRRCSSRQGDHAVCPSPQTFAQAHRMANTKSEPQPKSCTLGRTTSPCGSSL